MTQKIFHKKYKKVLAFSCFVMYSFPVMKYFTILTISAVSLLSPCVVAIAATQAETIKEHFCYGLAFATTTFYFFRMQKIVLAMK